MHFAVPAAGFDAREQLNLNMLAKRLLKHGLGIAGRAFAPDQRQRSLCTLDTAAYAGVVAKDQFAFADIFKKGIAVLLREQAASVSEVPGFGKAGADLLCHVLSVAASAFAAAAADGLRIKAVAEGCANVQSPAEFARSIRSFGQGMLRREGLYRFPARDAVKGLYQADYRSSACNQLTNTSACARI